jgi:hypothetical protein
MKEKTMIDEMLNLWMSAKADDKEIPSWKALDIVTRKWAVMSGFEKDQASFSKIKEMYE